MHYPKDNDCGWMLDWLTCWIAHASCFLYTKISLSLSVCLSVSFYTLLQPNPLHLYVLFPYFNFLLCSLQRYLYAQFSLIHFTWLCLSLSFSLIFCVFFGCGAFHSFSNGLLTLLQPFRFVRWRFSMPFIFSMIFTMSIRLLCVCMVTLEYFQ